MWLRAIQRLDVLTPEQLADVNTQVGHLQVAGPDGDLAWATRTVRALQDVLATIAG
jgi:hypothetical protein